MTLEEKDQYLNRFFDCGNRFPAHFVVPQVLSEFIGSLSSESRIVYEEVMPFVENYLMKGNKLADLYYETFEQNNRKTNNNSWNYIINLLFSLPTHLSNALKGNIPSSFNTNNYFTRLIYQALLSLQISFRNDDHNKFTDYLNFFAPFIIKFCKLNYFHLMWNLIFSSNLGNNNNNVDLLVVSNLLNSMSDLPYMESILTSLFLNLMNFKEKGNCYIIII